MLTIKLPAAAPAGTIVRRAGKVLLASSLGVAVRLDPGEHLVVVEYPGTEPREHLVTLSSGEPIAR